MISKLNGWSLTEGRIPGEWMTRDPAIAEVVAALEAIDEDQENPYVILEAPEIEGVSPGFCQTVATEHRTYCCEIRLFGRGNDGDRHYNLMRPDEQGLIGVREPDRPDYIAGYDPDIVILTTVFMAFIADPTALPEIPGWQWLDVTHENNPTS